MTTNGNNSAHPITPGSQPVHNGLTKREFFASQILAGIVSKGGRTPDEAVEDAIYLADALIKGLNQPEQTPKINHLLTN